LGGDEERSKEKETPSSFRGAASTAGGSQSDLTFGGGGSGQQSWSGGAGAGFGLGGAANAKPVVGWNHSAATDNESQGGSIWGCKSQTTFWGQMSGKDTSLKGKRKVAEAEQQGSKIVNPNLKQKPAAGATGGKDICELQTPAVINAIKYRRQTPPHVSPELVLVFGIIHLDR
jgi:hypothetical protein